MNQQIKIITAPAAVPTAPVDRMGGEAQGLVSKSMAKGFKNLAVEDFEKGISEAMTSVRNMAERLKSIAGDFETDEITIGIAVSADGDIGIASAGVEATIEVKLKRRKQNVS